MNKSRRFAAYHEAGHAVMIEKVGAKVLSVTVGHDASTKFMGATKLSDHQYIMCMVAGVSSSYIAYKGKTSLDYCWARGGAADMRKVNHLTNGHQIDAIERLTRQILKEHWWEAVEAVANALLQHDRLSGSQVRKLIVPVDPTRMQ